MSKFKRIGILIAICAGVGLVLASGVVDLSETVRHVDLKEQAQMERACIDPKYYADQDFKEYLKIKSVKQKTTIVFKHVADRPMAIPKALKKDFRDKCTKGINVEGQPPWGFFLATVTDRVIESAKSLEPNTLPQGIEPCLNSLLASKSYSIKPDKVRDLTLGICAKPTSNLLDKLRKRFFKNKEATYGPAEALIVEQSVKKILDFKFEINEPVMFAYARLHLALGREGNIKAAFVSRQRGISPKTMDEIFAKVLKTEFPKLPGGTNKKGVWVSFMLDFQSKRLNAVPIKKVKYY